jgi:hypothetical protein
MNAILVLDADPTNVKAILAGRQAKHSSPKPPFLLRFSFPKTVGSSNRSTATKATTMPVANYKTYCAMLDRARAGRFAFLAINVTSLTTANGSLVVLQ